MYNYCLNRGEMNVNLHKVKLGNQKCLWCEAEIDVKMTSERYAFYPKHKRVRNEY